ncbi:MAG: hypothetical protein AAF541_06895 [Pseudomonadota bacterium]
METDQIEALVAKRINKFLNEDAVSHRNFLETMFKRVTGLFAILAATITGMLYFMLGNSADEAVTNATKTIGSVVDSRISKFLAEEEVPERLRVVITDELNKLEPEIQDDVEYRAKTTVRKEVELAMDAVVKQKLSELRNVTIDELIARGLKGERGPRGETGRAGAPDPLTLEFYSLEAPAGRTVTESLGATFCTLLGVEPINKQNPHHTCKVIPAIHALGYELQAFGALCSFLCVDQLNVVRIEEYERVDGTSGFRPIPR